LTRPPAALLRALQVEPAHVHISPAWQPALQALLQRAACALGLAQQAWAPRIHARLYKLLLYQQGDHFTMHQDSEKEPGMFGTLVVQLPCQGGHEGGVLVVRHGGSSIEHNFSQVGDWAGLGWAPGLGCQKLMPASGGDAAPRCSSCLRGGPERGRHWCGAGPGCRAVSCAADRRAPRACRAATRRRGRPCSLLPTLPTASTS
jgi:hypothetical protein